MKRRDVLKMAGAAAVGYGLGGFPLGWTADQAGTKRRVLMFTKSSGFQHSVVFRKDGELSHSERILVELGQKNGFEVVPTKDGGVFTSDNLAQYDAFFFITTGDLTQPGTDRTPPMSQEGKQALLDAIKGGKGFVGSHCASDTFHSSGGRIDPYIEMIGGEFISHGAQQEAEIDVVDRNFPGVTKLGASFRLLDEWYSLVNLNPDLHVILVQNTQGMEGWEYQRPPYPETWARRHGQGRVFYTSMGHREDVWTNPLFHNVLLGALAWATGNVQAEVPPNMGSVTPGATKYPTRPASNRRR